MHKIAQKLPLINEVTPVFAVTATVIYGWTIFRFLEKLPSWLYYSDGYQVLSYYSYATVINFLEAVFFCSAICLLSILLPKRFLGDAFRAKGSLLALMELIYVICLVYVVGESKSSQFPWSIFNWTPLISFLIFILALWLPKFQKVKAFMEDLSDRTIIFLFILIPMSFLGLVIVITNNIV